MHRTYIDYLKLTAFLNKNAEHMLQVIHPILLFLKHVWGVHHENNIITILAILKVAYIKV